MIPLTAGLMLALLVLPLTNLLTRWLRHRLIATVATLMIVLAVLGLAAAAFGDQLARVAGRAPEMISLVAQQVSDTDPGADSVLQRVRESFRELDRAAERIAGIKPLIQPGRSKAAAAKAAQLAASAAAASEPQVSISQSASVALRETAVSGSGALVRLAGDLTIILFIAFFVLVGGAPLATRFLDLWSERPGLRLRAEHAANECVRQIRIYGGVLLVTNTVVGLAVWAAFSATGLPDAAGWGITAAVLHVVPYLGMALLTGLGAAEAFLAHGTLGAALGMAGFIVLLSTLIGTVVTAWLQGRAAKMNAAAVFIGVVFWGALWGVWGLLLGPALVVLLKVVAEHTRPGQRLAHLMQG
jgi:predicted PurR-regulated permease PerM